MEQKIFEPDFKPFEEPVIIKFVINGKNLIAEIMGEINDPIQPCFVIQVSNGVRFEAVASEVENDWVVNDKRFKPYLFAIRQELDSFLSVMHGDWYKFEINHNERNILVWVSYREADDYPYIVHFDGDYKFHLREGIPIWDAITVRQTDPAPINEEIVHKVAQELQKRIYL